MEEPRRAGTRKGEETGGKEGQAWQESAGGVCSFFMGRLSGCRLQSCQAMIVGGVSGCSARAGVWRGVGWEASRKEGRKERGRRDEVGMGWDGMGWDGMGWQG